MAPAIFRASKLSLQLGKLFGEKRRTGAGEVHRFAVSDGRLMKSRL
jgi:hypothetical protein